MSSINSTSCPASAPARGAKKAPCKFWRRLVGGQSRLTDRNPHAFEQTRVQLQHSLGIALAQLCDCSPGQQFCMVEATLALLHWMHGNRDDHHLPRHRAREAFQGNCQQHTEPAGDWPHAVVFQQVHQGAQFAMVAAVGDCFLKRRRSQAARLAKASGFGLRFRKGREVRDAQIFPATSAESPLTAKGDERSRNRRWGARVKRSREAPQRAQGQGNKAQQRLSAGLRSTRTTARQTEVWAGGTSRVSDSV